MLNIWYVVHEPHRTMQEVGSYKYVYLRAEDDIKVLHFVYDYLICRALLNHASYENYYTLG